MVDVAVATEAVVDGVTVALAVLPDVVDTGSSVVHAATPIRAIAADPLPIVVMKARLLIIAFPRAAVRKPYPESRDIGRVPPWI